MFVIVYDSTATEKWAYSFGGGTNSRALAYGINAIDSCYYAVTGSYLSPPEVIHTDTLPTYGLYDFYFTANHDNCLGSTTAISELNEENFVMSLFPNPAADEITISFNEPGNTQMQFFDLCGRLVFDITTDKKSITIPIHAWNDGLYLVHVFNPDHNILKTSKFMKAGY